MMKQKLLISELQRVRILMGLNLLSETKILKHISLLVEGGKVVDNFLGLSSKTYDNLQKTGIDFASDISKLSDEFTNLGIKSFDDLQNYVMKINNKLDPSEVTDEMIRNYIKSNEKLYNSILQKASDAAGKEAEKIFIKSDIDTLFKGSKDTLEAYKIYLSYAPTKNNVDTLISGLDSSIKEVENLIDDIQTNGVNGNYKVPQSLVDLYEQLVAKKQDAEGFKTKSTSPQTPTSSSLSKNVASEVKWGNLGDGYTISNQITNFYGRYVVMVKDASGRLRPFYQRTGGGGVDEGWAASGNWVPFYGIADVTIMTSNGLQKVDGWMIKPESGRMGEVGDDIISKLIGETVGTNGIKDVDYGIGNFSKSVTNTPTPSAMNDWLRSFGYEITLENGYLKYFKSPNTINGIP